MHCYRIIGWVVLTVVLIGSIREKAFAGEDQPSEAARRKADDELIKRHERLRELDYQMRSFVTPPQALRRFESFQRKYSQYEAELTAKIRADPSDTNSAKILKEVRLDGSLFAALDQEVCARIFQQYTASNALANVAEQDLRDALLYTTNRLTAAQITLLRELATPEATLKRKQLLTENWQHFENICKGGFSRDMIKDWTPLVIPPSSQPGKSPEEAPIPADFKLPQPD